jgi:squalene-associated FAD-dependent desaturase
MDRLAHVGGRHPPRYRHVNPRIVVVGAGWSGLACAVSLLESGAAVTLVDAAPQVGGRARGVNLRLGDRSFALDNGQHLMLGAYRECLALARRVGVDVDRAFRTFPFALRYPDGFELVARRAPHPWHLAGALFSARGLGVAQRLAAAGWILGWKRRRWTLQQDTTAATVLAGQPDVLNERVWGPLCLAALNARPPEASARIFLNVLRDSLGADARSSEMLLPRGDLSSLFPRAAARALGDAGAEVRLRTPVLTLTRRERARWQVGLRGGALDADAVVLALPPERAAALLRTTADTAADPAIALLGRLESAPIATVYLRYRTGTRLPHPVYALLERPHAGDHGQWVFDRGALAPDNDGVLAVVISGAGPHLDRGTAATARSVSRQLARAFRLGDAIGSAVLVEKRATIVPRPGLERPAATLPLRGLFLAGDAAASDFPSTIEGSVRAGQDAARAVLAQLRLSRA